MNILQLQVEDTNPPTSNQTIDQSINQNVHSPKLWSRNTGEIYDPEKKKKIWKNSFEIS